MNIAENSFLTTTTGISNEKASNENIEAKRKLPSESVGNGSNEEPNHDKLKIQNVEQFLNEAGLNLQLIDKNDKKFVKLNIDLNNFKKLKFINHVNDSCETINSPIKNNAHFENQNVKNNNAKIQSFNLRENSEEDIDLPSESDLSNMITIVPTSKRASNKPFLSSSPNNSAQIPYTPKNMSIFYKCMKCSKLFSNDTLLKMHKQSDCQNIKNTTNETKIFNDETKGDHVDLSNRREQMSELNCSSHLADRAGKSPRKRVQICNECGMQFETQTNLIKHIQKIHQTLGSFECPQCHMSFCDQQSKNRHEKESHVKPFRCYICSFEFTRASNLRAHLLKVHPNEIGKLVNISKTIDNKLKFEFDLDAINEYREQMKSLKSSQLSPYLYPNTQTNQILSQQSNSNSVICIKDPNTKNAETEHMMVYVDGKPMFAQSNKKHKVEESSIFAHLDANNNIIKGNNSLDEINSSFYLPAKKAASSFHSKSKSFSNSSSSTISNKPVAKIPYLLAAAAAAAASNQRKQQTQQTQAYKNQFTSTNKIVSSECARSSCYTLINSNHLNMKSSKDLNKEQEYIQLVSLLKQKNEKLFNPLVDKSF